MKKVKITLEVLTNMLSFGDNKNSAEFRITELKSLMRNTFRELYYFKDKKEMKEREDELFGNMERKSPISFRLIGKKLKGEKKVPMLPHKKEDREKAKTKCLVEGSEIELYMITNSKLNIEFYVILLVQASIIGALGKRSRKGFGSFRVINIEEIEENGYKEIEDNKYTELLENEPNQILAECDEKLIGIFKEKYKIRENMYEDKNDNEKIDVLDFPYITKIRFVKIEKQYSKLIEDISQLTHDRLRKTDFVKEIENRNKINKNILGNCTKGIRFASPISVSFWEKDNENGSETEKNKYMIIKELNYKYILNQLNTKGKEAKEANEKYIQKYIERLFEIGGAKK